MKVFSIKDRKADCFNAPFFQENVQMAERTLLAHLIENPNSMLSRFAEDYDLYDVGDWDEKSGSLNGIMPRHICSVWSVAKMVEHAKHQAEEVMQNAS